jgi:hypothetical protein
VDRDGLKPSPSFILLHPSSLSAAEIFLICFSAAAERGTALTLGKPLVAKEPPQPSRR